MSLYVYHFFNRTENDYKKRQLICNRCVIFIPRGGIMKSIKEKYHQLLLLAGIVVMVFLIIRGNDTTTAAEPVTDTSTRVDTYFSLETGFDLTKTIFNFPRQFFNILFRPSEAQLRFFLRDGFAFRSSTVPLVERIGMSSRDEDEEIYMLTWQPSAGFVRHENLVHERSSGGEIPTPRYINSSEPIVYLFNSHPHEMIGAPSLARYREGGTDYILEFTHMLASVFADYRIPVLVEDRDVRDVLRRNGWVFGQSYQASRMFIEERYHQYPSLQFFFDIHRDGVPDSVATRIINGESYARIIFVIGFENPYYEENYAMAMRLHEMLEAKRPGISRGIFPSVGVGRNAVYNQDFSPKLQLIEIGSVQSTREEMVRSTQVLAEVLAEYILNYLD